MMFTIAELVAFRLMNVQVRLDKFPVSRTLFLCVARAMIHPNICHTQFFSCIMLMHFVIEKQHSFYPTGHSSNYLQFYNE